MNRNVFFIAVLFVTVLQACKNDFEVNAPYAENAAIYGVLNPDTTTQVIRINKAFLGQGDAKAYAKIPDSINYGNELKAWLVRGKDTSLLKDTLLPLTGKGDFIDPSNPGMSVQKVYITRNKITGSLDSATSLIVKNAKTGKKYTATTDMVGNIGLTYKPTWDFYSNSGQQAKFTIGFSPAKNAVKYMVILRFYYTEVIKEVKYPKFYDYVTYIDPAINVGQGGNMVTPGIMGGDYYRSLATYVKANATDGYIPGTHKRVIDVNGNMQVFCTAYNDILNTYIEVNKPSSGISQDKLTYGNITGGVGILAAKKTAKYSKNAKLGIESLTQLKSTNPDTRDLDFVEEVVN